MSEAATAREGLTADGRVRAVSSLEILVLAVALAMDAVAVSLARGLVMKQPTWRQALLLAGAFGLFQALMPVLGWLLASWFADAVRSAAPWIAFGLLALIGGTMIKGSFDDDDDDNDQDGPGAATVPLLQVLTLAVATSIDAFAVGVTFAVLQVAVGPAVVVIGLVTFVLSLAAVFLGARVGERLGSRAELAGGVVLVLIGVRIVLDHLGVI